MESQEISKTREGITQDLKLCRILIMNMRLVQLNCWTPATLEHLIIMEPFQSGVWLLHK